MDNINEDVVSNVEEQYIRMLKKEIEKLEAEIRKFNINEMDTDGVEIDDDKFPWK